MIKVNFDEVSRIALQHARSLVNVIAPGGTMVGPEYTCATVNGGKGTSCKINVNTGKWGDFSAGEQGGDFISLWAAANRVPQLEAAKQLAAHLGIAGENVPSKARSLPPPRVQNESGPVEEPYNLVPIPATVRQPTFFHAQLGAASAHYCYLGEGGERLFWIARYDTKDGKQFTPFSWCQNRNMVVPKAWPDPRPLFGLDLLKSNPRAPVMVVEGEKAAEAARKFVKSYVVVTWSGGSKAYSKTDWTPLHGRNVLLWPDNDLKLAKTEALAKKHGIAMGERIPITEQPGMQAMLGIAELIATHSEVKYFSLHEHPLIGEIDGFDAADAEQMAWDWDTFLKVVKPIAKIFEPKMPVTPVETILTPWVQGSAFVEQQNAGLELKGDGTPHATLDNVARMINYHPNLKGKIWFDEFHLKILTTWRSSSPVQWSDLDDLALCRIFQGQFKMPQLKVSTINDGVRVYADENRRNEPRDWMNSLKWDGKNRIEDFFTAALGVEPSGYVKAACKNFFIAMAARIFHPGCKMDNMVILEGKQGAQKSTALRVLGGDWFTESSEAVTSKDFRQVLTGNMIVEIPELASLLKGSNQEEIKAILSDPDDYFRPPYGRAPMNFKRTCVFVGTTNDEEYLDDATGGRRYWPVYCHKINIKFIEQNREQLFAEAVHRYKNKESWWEMPDEETKAAQRSRQMQDEWETEIQQWLNLCQDRAQDYVILKDFAQNYLQLELKEANKAVFNRLAKIMKSLGWRKIQRKVLGENLKVWIPSDRH